MTYVLIAVVMGSLPHSQFGTIRQFYPSLLACMEAGFELQAREFRRVRKWDCQRFTEGEDDD